jgi:hypothetical protein
LGSMLRTARSAGGPMKVIASIEEAVVIGKIL